MATVHLLWDASAVAKRYAPEVGSDVVDELFQQAPLLRPVLTIPGYAEIVALLQRKKNAGAIATTTFQTAVSSLQTDFLMNPDAVLLTITDKSEERRIARAHV
ncbi:MAG: hypothetical protein H7Y38_05015, partial [Armatimonadetes bacterium]|nr:hypothetical protein [Armatimonadota bacterium]